MDINKKIKSIIFPLVFVLFTPFLIQCAYIEHLASQVGIHHVQFGDVVLWSNENEADKKSAIHSGLAPIPQKKLKIRSRKNKEIWGSCEPLKDPGFLSRFKKTKITIEKIKLGRTSSKTWKELSIKRQSIDLFSLAPSLSKILSSHQLPEGDFNEIRILTSKAYIYDTEGQKWPLEIQDKNGIQIRLNRDISVIDTEKKSSISLSFCTQTNFLVKKNNAPIPTFTFHPVINKVINISI